jgi:ubiquinone/menaquinone biosynthesis C-methylase UbiE
MKENEQHWEKIYTNRSASQVGWYTPHLETSMRWISKLKLAPEDPIIDIGGGASTLVDDLLDLGHRDLTILDLSSKAIHLTKERLGNVSHSITWLHGDVTEIKLPSDYFRLWHDRAVFHFLIESENQRKYRDAILASLKRGGFFIIGAFAPDAPPKCSGLPVQHYTTELLRKSFGKQFKLKHHRNEIHITPSGVKQSYLYCLFQRTA